ncbi:GyrI-like domain-containing protein [Georgenia wangjunii]|uniref:GyrI-like domain-containing protein n=1 Tax=Georgenia wangjunii TaxID=3117730 RepID=UPI002F263E21
MPDKVDAKKDLDAYRARRGQFRLVDVPDMRYLMVDGHGDPNTSTAFSGALEALYPVAYRLKFMSRRELGRDYVVPPLEGLWWADDMAAFAAARDKSRWDWTIMIMVPDWVDDAMVETAVEGAGAKDRPERLDDLRLGALSEGLCAQTLHVGTFDAEAEVLARMHAGFIPDNGLRMSGTHHEIYLSDFRKVAPEKQRTILRQPVSAAEVPP